MLTKSEVIEKAGELGFADIGFTTAEPFIEQRRVLEERKTSYDWVIQSGLDLIAGTDPNSVLEGAETVIVLLEHYFREAFPKILEPFFGRCYLDDDRVSKEHLAPRIRAFRGFLEDAGIRSKLPFHMPHRVAAARAGLGTFGKNCLFYANRVGRRSSFVLPLAVVVDQPFAPDRSSAEIGCPAWCRNACMTACPTGALEGPRRIEPSRCISYLTYYGKGITPREMRAPMGLWVYGCDRCQNVCPRNTAWLSADLPVNERVEKKAAAFSLPRLLRMDRSYFERHIWPHMFYMGADDIWRWQMNAARAMGNSLDEAYVADLGRAFEENQDERVCGMCAWALGRIGGRAAKVHLERFRSSAAGLAKEEAAWALMNRGRY
jgi:epoxyqueuosine reductase